MRPRLMSTRTATGSASQLQLAPIFFINRVYWPEEAATAQLLTDLAEGLAARGHHVTVIAGRSAPDAPRRELRNGVTVLRVPSWRSGHLGLAGKAFDYILFLAGALLRLLFVAERKATIVALTDPPLLGVGAWWVAAWHGARLYHWVQDIYPELAVALGGPRAIRALVPLRNLSWRAADCCVVIGHDLGMEVHRGGVPPARITVVPNWAPARLSADARNELPDEDEKRAELRREWGLNGRFAIIYSGNLGRVHEFAPLLAIAAELRDEPEYTFIFIGDGAQRAGLLAGVARLGLTNVQFRPAQPRESLGPALRVADVHLVTLRGGCENLVFPSKLYGVAAVGRPIIFIGPRESAIARLIEDQGLGCSFEYTETASILLTLRMLRGSERAVANFAKAALRFSRASGGASAAVDAWEELLREPVGTYIRHPEVARKALLP